MASLRVIMDYAERGEHGERFYRERELTLDKGFAYVLERAQRTAAGNAEIVFISIHPTDGDGLAAVWTRHDERSGELNTPYEGWTITPEDAYSYERA